MDRTKTFLTGLGCLALGALISFSAYLNAQSGGGPEGGGGKPSGSAFSTQYNNSGSFGGAGPGSAGNVLTSNGAGAAPTFQPAGAPTGAALTRTDDTNVTLTLGGTPATALLQATSITAGWTGTLAAARGGTDGASPTDDNVMVGSGTVWQSKAVPNCADTGGQHLNYTTSSNAFSCGTSGSSSAFIATVFKTATTTRNNNTVSDDPDLTVANVPAGNYMVEGDIKIASDATAGMRASIRSGGTESNNPWITMFCIQGGTTAVGESNAIFLSDTPISLAGVLNTTNDSYCHFSGTWTLTGTGTVALQWAQTTTNAPTNTKVYNGSWFRISSF